MNEVKEFDKKLLDMNDGSFLGSKIPSYLLFLFGIALMGFPIQSLGREGWALINVTFCMDILGMVIALKPYVIVNENGRPVSIYKKLMYTPVNIKHIFKQRLYYMNRKTTVILVLSLCIQLFAAFCTKEILIKNIVYPCVVVGATWLLGLIYIMPLSRSLHKIFRWKNNREEVNERRKSK